MWVPDAGHEAMRDLARARLAAVQALRRARQQLSGFLLRQGRHYGRPTWTQLHRRWLAGLKFEQPVHQTQTDGSLGRHGRARPGHPRTTAYALLSPWMPGTRPGMTIVAIMDHMFGSEH